MAIMVNDENFETEVLQAAEPVLMRGLWLQR